MPVPTPPQPLRPADRLALAGLSIPDELAPLDPKAELVTRDLAITASESTPDQRADLLRRARALPQQPRTDPAPATPPHEQYLPGLGGALLRMAANRNLRWMSVARLLHTTRGLYVAASTIGGIGHDRVPLSLPLLADFSALLDVPLATLTALAGLVPETDSLPPRVHPPHPATPDIAALLPELARLTADQVRELAASAGLRVR
ncbi:hypothetical protein ABZW30_32835 [Kitasatospora sp. NPDC004669]|uniref:hypothetical protein n=1 Tax=Kitasatospora sp. NPDC004669 TaxID=3154555 RepID=UPI0033AC5962